MKTYIIEIKPFPHVMGHDKTVKIQSEKDLDTVLELLNKKLTEENPMFEYDLFGYTLEEFIDGMELVEID